MGCLVVLEVDLGILTLPDNRLELTGEVLLGGNDGSELLLLGHCLELAVEAHELDVYLLKPQQGL